MSADEWDADDFEPSAPNVLSSDRWAGEDDGDVKDAWDAEDDDAKKADGNEEGIKAVQRKKKKPLAERIAEKELEKAAREKQEKEDLRVKSKDELKADAEKLKKIQEESDLKLAKEAFGVDVDATGIDSMYPVDEEEFDKFRDALKLKITCFNSSKFYGPFLEKLMQELVVDLSLDDLKKISTLTSSLFHEKQRQQKELEKQKKKKKVKSNVTMERDTDFSDIAAAGRGDFDDAYYDEDFL